MTFADRVEQFWNWFTPNAERFFNTIEDGRCPDLQPEFTEKTGELFPGFAWVFGPGEDGVGHSFTLSADGDIHRQFLTSFWKDQAPELPGWTFYASRQASELEDEHVIDFEAVKIGAGDLMIDARVNKDNENIDITAWHPDFAKCEEDFQWQILFIWLDEALGETGTQTWIGEIEIKPELSEKSVPLTQLKQLVENVAKACEWEKLSPDLSYTLYQVPEPNDEFPRSDTISGSTCNMNLISDFLNGHGNMEDPLEGLGAEFLYVSIDPRIFPEGQEIEARGKIEDALDDALAANNAGRVIGAAFGLCGAYIDLVIFAGESSIAIISQTLEQFHLGDRFEICRFANLAASESRE